MKAPSWVWLLVCGCAVFKGTPTVEEEGGPSMIDDTDTDDDGEDDTDTDSTSDTDDSEDTDDTEDTDDPEDTDDDTDEEELDCDEPVPPETRLDECVTAYVGCGDRFVSTVYGGTSVMDNAEYLSWYCGWDFTEDDYTGTERIYYFENEGKTATIELESPCGDLDLIVAKWEQYGDDGTCPTEATTNLSSCDMDDSNGGGEVVVYDPDGTEYSYLIIVDGKELTEENFILSVTCE